MVVVCCGAAVSDALRQGRPLHDVLTMVGQDAGDAEAEQETAMKAFVFPHTFLVQEWLEERQPQRATADSDSARGRGRHRQVWYVPVRDIRRDAALCSYC